MANTKKRTTVDTLGAAMAARKAGRELDRNAVVSALAQASDRDEKAKSYQAQKATEAAQKAQEAARAAAQAAAEQEERRKAALEGAFRSAIGQKADIPKAPTAKDSYASVGQTLTQKQLDNVAVKNAEKDTKAATKAYDTYRKSDERKTNVDAATNEILKKVFGNLGTGNVDLSLQNAPQKMLDAETKETELRAKKDYAEHQEQTAKDTRTLNTDMAELRSWSKEDKAGLEAYIREEDNLQNRQNWDILSNSSNPESTALIKKYGYDKVKEMAESYRWQQSNQLARQAQQDGVDGANKSVLSAVGHNVGSVGANLLGGISAPLGYVQELGQRTGRYTTLNPNNIGQLPSVYASGVRNQTAENIEKSEALRRFEDALAGAAGYTQTGEIPGMKVNQPEKEGDGSTLGKAASEVYQAGMTAADSLARAATGGGGTVIPGLLAAGQGFGSTVSQASRQGASPTQALSLGAVNAGIEAATEKYSLENLLSTAKNGSSGLAGMLKNAAIQGGIETSEEEASLAGTTAAERLILGGKSAYDQQIQEGLANGLSYAQAKAGADKGLLTEAGETGLISALSGGMSSFGAEAANRIGTKGSRATTDTDTKTEKSEVSKLADQLLKGLTGKNTDTKTNQANTADGNQRAKLEQLDAAIKDTLGIPVQNTVANDTNAISNPLDSYPTEKQNAIRDYIQSVDESIKSFVQRVKSGDRTFKRQKISDVSKRAAADIGKVLGIDASGYTHNINTNGVQHIITRHGENGKQDSSMALDDDIARVGWVLDNYDSVEPVTENGKQVYSSEFMDSSNNPAPQIRFIKKIDGTYYVVEAACENAYKKLWVQSAYLQKNNGDVTQASAESQTADHGTNAQSALASPSPNNNISEGNGIVNGRTPKTYTTEEFQARMDMSEDEFLSSMGDRESAPNPMADRTWSGVGKRDVDAYMYENPEVKPFFQMEAVNMLTELKSSTKAEKGYNEDVHYATGGEKGWYGVKRNTSKSIEGLLDSGITYDQIEKGLNAIIQDHGAENNAVSKRIEFVLNDRLMNGYQDFFSSDRVEPSDDYIAMLNGKSSPMVDTQERSTEGGQQTESGIPRDFEAMGAASAGFSPFSRMQYEYGNIPDGENAVRPDDMPVSTNGTDRVSYTARTVKGAAATPESFIGDLEDLVVKGGMSYIPIQNNETAQKAADHIKQVGWESALTDWTADVRSGKTGADLAATGAILLNNAANAGDEKAWLDILDDYRKLGTNTAQGLQAFRILKTLAPDDQLYMIHRSVDQMVKDMHLETEITIDEDLEKAYREAENDKERDKALDAIQQNVADQIPSTAMDKWTALRYLNMLGNFRTQVRNITGNIGAKGTYLAKDEIAATLEAVASAVSGGKIQRTKSIVVNKDLKKAAAADFDGIQSAVLDGGKYSDSTAQSTEFAQGVQDKRRIFKNPVLEGYRKVTNWAMNEGDIVFAKGAYARAMAGYLQANGVKGNSLEGVDNALLDKARTYAVKEAQETTFRDNNMFSSWISKVGRRKDTPKAAKMVAEGIMPFRKTPANVLVRAEEYSPLGLINSAVKTVQGAKGEATGAEVINSWAKTLTGTGLFILGAALGNMGVLTGGPDSDEDKAEFDELNGYQNYALQLPDGTNLTIDFLSPTAMPMFMGAQLAKIIEDGGYSLADFEDMFTSLADPMIQMSMLQGVNDTIDNLKYTDDNLGQFLMNATMSYLTQGISNTLLGQLERSSEDSRMTTYVDKDSNVPAWLQRQIGKLSAKTPGWDYQQTPYLNAWGEEEKNPEGVKDYLYNLFSPSYIDKAEVDAVAEELYRLNEVQSDVNVFPKSPEQTLTYTDKDGKRHEDYNLSMEEYQRLKEVEGRTQAKLVSDLVDSKDYQALTDDQKAKAVSLAYDYAREQGRVDVIPDYDGYSDGWMDGIDGKEAAAIVNKVAAADISDAMSAMTSAWKENHDDTEAREALESAFQVYDGMSDDAKKSIRESATGRLDYYLDARAKGIKTDTFIDLYKTYWEIDQSNANTSDKAQKWAYELERAEETRKINARQKAALKDSMVYYQMFPAGTEKFDQLTESGLSAKSAQDLGYLLNGLVPQTGYKQVRDVQKAEAIMSSRLGEADKVAALKVYGSDAQDEKLEEMTGMGFSAADYVEAWRIYSDETGTGKKARTIEKYRKEFGVDEATARAIYDVYG